MVESIGFGDQLSVRMGMWRLVECSGEEEPREFPGLRQN